MYQHEEDVNQYFNTVKIILMLSCNHFTLVAALQNYTVHYWLSRGLRPGKLVLGMPMYGQSFTLDTSGGDNGECTISSFYFLFLCISKV